jgi:hypothetical protein
VKTESRGGRTGGRVWRRRSVRQRRRLGAGISDESGVQKPSVRTAEPLRESRP